MAESAEKKEGYTYGEWRQAMNRMPPRRESAPPPPSRPPASIGSIHTDETAKKIGMRGAVVAGPMHLDCFQKVLLDVFGPKCFETGSISMFWTYAMLDGEELRVMVKTPPKGANNIQVDARIEMRDGRTVAEGTVALGNPQEKSYVHNLKLESSPPEELRILKGLEVGFEMIPIEVTAKSEDLRNRLSVLEDTIEWNSGKSPWGKIVVPPSMGVGLMRMSTGQQWKGVGFFGATALQYINGPILADVEYQVKSRIIAVGATSKTEYYWHDAGLYEKSSGKQVAAKREMIRFMKAGSPLYPEIK